MADTACTPDEIMTAFAEMRVYIGELVAAKRAEPVDDLTSALAAAEELSPNELVANLQLLVVAGYDTTAVTATANIDPRVYPDPATPDITRSYRTAPRCAPSAPSPSPQCPSRRPRSDRESHVGSDERSQHALPVGMFTARHPMA